MLNFVVRIVNPFFTRNVHQCSTFGRKFMLAHSYRILSNLLAWASKSVVLQLCNPFKNNLRVQKKEGRINQYYKFFIDYFFRVFKTKSSLSVKQIILEQ